MAYTNPPRTYIEVPRQLPSRERDYDRPWLWLSFVFMVIVFLAGLFIGTQIERSRPWPCEPSQTLDTNGHCINAEP